MAAGLVPEPHDARVVGLGADQLQSGFLGEQRPTSSDSNGMDLEDVLVDESDRVAEEASIRCPQQGNDAVVEARVGGAEHPVQRIVGTGDEAIHRGSHVKDQSPHGGVLGVPAIRVADRVRAPWPIRPRH